MFDYKKSSSGLRFNRGSKSIQGFTLLEILLVLGIITVGSMSAIMIAKHNNVTQNTVQAVTGARHIADSFRQSFGQAEGYAKVSSKDLVAVLPRAPSFAKSDAGVSFKNWGPVTVSSRASGQVFALSFAKVPIENCTKLASQFSTGSYTAEVNGTPANNPKAMAALCGASKTSMVSLVSPTVLLPKSVAFGEKPIGSDNGASLAAKPVNPPTLPSWSQDGLTFAAPPLISLPSVTSFKAPTISVASIPSRPVSSVSTPTGGTSAGVPSTSLPLPKASCVANALVSKPVSTSESSSRLTACPSPQTGSITEKGTRTVSTTTTTATTCPAGPMGSPTMTISKSNTATAWIWSPTGNSCSTPAPSGPDLTGMNFLAANPSMGWNGPHRFVFVAPLELKSSSHKYTVDLIANFVSYGHIDFIAGRQGIWLMPTPGSLNVMSRGQPVSYCPKVIAIDDIPITFHDACMTVDPPNNSI